MRNASVIAAVFTVFAILLEVTLLSMVADRGILAVVGFGVGLWLAWPKTDADARPIMVVGLVIAGAIGAVAMPLVMSDTLPRLLHGDLQGAAISLIAPVAVWMVASWVKDEMRSGV